MRERFGVPPGCVAWCFDRGPYRRRETCPGYKAGRRRGRSDEEEAAHDELRACTERLRTDYLGRLGYGNVFAAPGFEADDLMARCVEGLPDGDRAVLVSGDQDLYQLLSWRAALYSPVADVLFTAREFRQKYGLSPARWAEVKALAGCATDDVPGIPGVGVKMAVTYLTTGRVRIAGLTAAIERFRDSEDYRRNLATVTIPHAETPSATPAHDPPYPSDGWIRLCAALDMDRLAQAADGRRYARSCE